MDYIMTNQDLQGRTIQARNPRTGEMDYSFEVTKNSEIEEIVSDLRSSQKAWSEKTIDQRAETLNDWAKALGTRHRKIFYCYC
jgi:acyl-CoA reductase-like NAD-dependent aldehyde dehydrogenase